jgi:hypothetical protein
MTATGEPVTIYQRLKSSTGDAVYGKKDVSQSSVRVSI